MRGALAFEASKDLSRISARNGENLHHPLHGWRQVIVSQVAIPRSSMREIWFRKVFTQPVEADVSLAAEVARPPQVERRLNLQRLDQPLFRRACPN